MPSPVVEERSSEQDRRAHHAARRICDSAWRSADGSGRPLELRPLTDLLADLGLLDAAARAKGAFWTAAPDTQRPAPSPGCGSVKEAQAHHRAGEPLCATCQAWSDERHLRTRIEPGSRCGTPAGAQLHRQLGEKVCHRCIVRKPPKAKPAARAVAITVVRAGAGTGMTLAEFARFVEQAFDAGAGGAETVTAHTPDQERLPHPRGAPADLGPGWRGPAA